MRSLFIVCLLILASAAHAGWVRVGDQWSDMRYQPTLTMQEHYDAAGTALQQENWVEAQHHYQIIVHHFRKSAFFSESLYQLGVCYYHLGDGDLANRCFSAYLDLPGLCPKFESVFDFKLKIADSFREGKKKHLFGRQSLPRIAPARSLASELYEEIIASLPSQEVAAYALFGKSELLLEKGEYKETIDSLQQLIRRFPKHSLAAEAYLRIGEVYGKQLALDEQNTDLIALARLNLQRCRKQFPGEVRLNQLEAQITAMESVHASSLYHVGRFYERAKKKEAAAIYYRDTVRRYPHTPAAQESQQRLDLLFPTPVAPPQ